MKFAARALIFFSILLLVPLSRGEEDKAANYVLCRLGPSVRTIRLVNVPEKGCRVLYTKEGTDKDVGGGKNLVSCHTILNNIRANLEKAAWKCRDISNATILEEQQNGK